MQTKEKSNKTSIVISRISIKLRRGLYILGIKTRAKKRIFQILPVHSRDAVKSQRRANERQKSDKNDVLNPHTLPSLNM